jgi:hypothetical protein
MIAEVAGLAAAPPGRLKQAELFIELEVIEARSDEASQLRTSERSRNHLLPKR